MKLTVISHACAVPINQQFYADVERLTGWDVTIVYPSNWRDDYGRNVQAPRWPDFRGKLIGVPVWKPGNIILHAYRKSLTSVFRQTQPDAIYVHHEPYAVATAQAYFGNARATRCPIGFYTAQNILKKYPLPFRVAESMVHKHTSFCFPVTAEIDQTLRARGYRGASTIQPLGVDPTVYRPREDTSTIKQRLQTGGEREVLIGYVGRVTEEKGMVTLLNALHQLKQLSTASWRLVVVGTGAFDAAFDKLAGELELTSNVTRVGAVPHQDVPGYYSAMDIVVVPSETRPNWKEQFGRVIIEALACGAAVVGSDSGEIPHLISKTGGGLLFPEAQPTALAQQLKKLVENAELRRQLADAGRAVVMREFTTESLAAKFAQTIEAAVAARSTSREVVMRSEPITVPG